YSLPHKHCEKQRQTDRQLDQPDPLPAAVPALSPPLPPAVGAPSVPSVPGRLCALSVHRSAPPVPNRSCLQSIPPSPGIFYLTGRGKAAILNKLTSGCGEAWYRAWFGSKRPWVQIPPLGPARRKRHIACDELFHFIAKLIARSFCYSSLPNRNRFAGLRFGRRPAGGYFHILSQCLFYPHRTNT